MAAGSYREAETAAYDNFVAGTASLWNDYLENYQKALDLLDAEGYKILE